MYRSTMPVIRIVGARHASPIPVIAAWYCRGRSPYRDITGQAPCRPVRNPEGLFVIAACLKPQSSFPFDRISAAGFFPLRFFCGMKIAFVRIMNKIPVKTVLVCGVFATGVILIHTRRSVLISFQHFNKR